MDFSNIKLGLEGFVVRYDSQTFIGSYRETSRSSLLNDGLSTRANSLWKMAEYVVAKNDNSSNPISSYIDGWKQLASGTNNQYLLLEEDTNVWGLYDAQGLRLGGEDYILDFFSKKKREIAVGNQKDNKNISDLGPLQQIFYGAPGTGKSNTIKKEVDEKKKTNFRVTFHPDSDYSTFVGAYKPAMKSPDREYSFEELVVKLNEIKLSGVTYPCHKFSAQYWKSLKKLTPEEIKQLLKACGFTDTMNVEAGKGIAVGEELSAKNKEEQIVYRFVPQAFTKAYTAAWNTEDDVFLIIEEINRGNCAQIFGDLFQLLDRGKDGFSEYPIDADSDLAEHIAKELSYSPRTDFPEGVKEGKKLVLPKNLYIWATMNTSDQSLFPIDSAFKRRWDWKYIKIKNHPEENYKIVVEDEERDWYEFIEKINDIIASMTSSADKQLGYFFCKADKNGKISAQTFVSKVIFYLWNDVFKDYGFEDTSLFRYVDEEDGKEKDLTFPAFYGEDSEEVNKTRLKDFLDKVMNWKKDKEEQK